MERAKRVFIVGCRRSGTTWTMLLLAQHPDVVALQQIDYLRRFSKLGSWYRTREEFGACALTPNLVEGVEAERMPDGLARVALPAAQSAERWVELARELVDDTYARFAALNPGTRALVEQTPEYVRIWEEVLELVPDARFLHIVRDPRSVFASQKNAARSWADPTRFSHDALAVAREWASEVEHGRAIAAALPDPERLLELRYEDLRGSPEEHLTRLHEWLDLPSDPESRKAAVEACSLERMRGTSHAPRGFFRKGETEGWRRELSRGEIRTIEYVAGELMRANGYELVNATPVKPPLKVRLRGGRERFQKGVARWAWQSDGVLKRGAARVLKVFPGLRKALLKGIKKPV